MAVHEASENMSVPARVHSGPSDGSNAASKAKGDQIPRQTILAVLNVERSAGDAEMRYVQRPATGAVKRTLYVRPPSQNPRVSTSCPAGPANTAVIVASL